MKKHIPVLAQKLIELTSPQKGECFVDITAGYGGHSDLLLQAVGDTGFGYLFDRDPQAVEALKQKFSQNQNIVVEQKVFSDISWQKLTNKVDILIADLGVNSAQLDEGERGFSFKNNGPLDMRMDTTLEFSAYDVVNSYSEVDLADIIYRYGEEPKSRQIAKQIVNNRKVKPINSTSELREIVSSVIRNHGKIDPATKTFQAIRIEVNDELKEIEHILEQAPKVLSENGRIAIISFHSLEDRLVKQAFKSLASPVRDERGNVVTKPSYRLVTKKPIKGSEFDKLNPRARSAKLRVLEKIN